MHYGTIGEDGRHRAACGQRPKVLFHGGPLGVDCWACKRTRAFKAHVVEMVRARRLTAAEALRILL